MITITGKVEDTNGAPQHVLVTFTSLSTPLVGAGVITGNSANSVRTLAADGTFEIDLKPGNYRVTYTANGLSTSFAIALSPDDDGDTLAIEDVVTSPLEFVATAPNTVWNGTRAGHITFDPIANPGTPTVSAVAYTGGHLGSETHYYKVSYVTQEGETALNTTEVSIVGAGTADRAARIALAVSPTRVTIKHVWRRMAAEATWWLIAEVAPAVAYYDDWMSDAEFALVINDLSETDGASLYNTTAGKILATAGSDIVHFSVSGLRILRATEITGPLTLIAGNDGGPNITLGSGGVLRVKNNLVDVVLSEGSVYAVETGTSTPAELAHPGKTAFLDDVRFTQSPVVGYVWTCTSVSLGSQGKGAWQAPTGGTPLGGSADPSAGAGVAATLYSTYAQVVSGVLERVWIKVGALDTDWN